MTTGTRNGSEHYKEQNRTTEHYIRAGEGGHGVAFY